MHDEYVQKIKDQANRLKAGSIDFTNSVECEKEKLLLCAALIKCADISNCVSIMMMLIVVYVYSIYFFSRQGHLKPQNDGQKSLQKSSLNKATWSAN
jgi:hypothetical protein